MLTTDQLAAIRKRCDKATPGPWGTEEHKFQITSDDFCFVCHAREDIPALLDEIERFHRLPSCRGACASVVDTMNNLNYWKARCEAMEEALVHINPCDSCIHIGEGEDGMQTCKLESPCDADWQFDEARFAGAGGEAVE